MEENHVAFPWGATIISGGEGLDGAKQGESMQASTGEGAAARISGVRSAALVRALHVLQTIGDCTLYLIDSPQTCVTTTRYCL